MEVINPFEGAQIGERYHRYRPRYHHIPVQKLSDILGQNISGVLDVGCGTGQSTHALALKFLNVTGCDSSKEMLSIATSGSYLNFVEANATELPFDNYSFSLLTVFMGFHWFDQIKFLKEARRVLRSPGFLAIDDYGFSGTMTNNFEFKHFYRNYYFKNFPAPTRNKDSLAVDVMLEHGFELIHEHKYTHNTKMNIGSFVSFLQTQSNLITAPMDQSELTKLLLEKFSPYFQSQEQSLEFSGTIRIYKIRREA